MIRTIDTVMRRLFVIGLLLVAGAVINVAVAWGCAWGARWAHVQPLLRDLPLRPWPERVSPRWLEPQFVVTGHTTFWGVTRYIAFETKSAGDGSAPTHTVTYAIDQFRYGWPWFSFRVDQWCEHELIGDPPVGKFRFDSHPAYSVWRNGFRAGTGNDTRMIPLRPIWPGFVINTVVYATLIGLVWFGFEALCRAIRRRRGLCARCAYPVGASSVCTECGAAVDTSRAREEGGE